LDAIPKGYEVSESKNGLPVLKRKAPEPEKPAKAPRKSSKKKTEE
jgi:hypothetical protein